MKIFVLFFSFLICLSAAFAQTTQDRAIVDYRSDAQISYLVHHIKEIEGEITGISIENLSCDNASQAEKIKNIFIEQGIHTQYNLFPYPARFCNSEPIYQVTIESIK